MSNEKKNANKGFATATLVAGALVSPSVMAVSDAQYRADMEAMMKKVEALEHKLSSVQQTQPKVQELDEWMASVKGAPAQKAKQQKEHMVFARGGYSHSNQSRGGFQGYAAGEDSDYLAGRKVVDNDAWYIGAGVDYSLTDDLFGLMDNTELLADLVMDYKELSTNAFSALPAEVTNTNGNPVSSAGAPRTTISQLTFSAAPKIKFLKGHNFRPWLIPFGLEANIISPPSGSFTSLTPGIQFGAGADYKIWKDLYIGADARYHYTTGKTEGVDIDGVTAGGYLGVGF